MLPPVHETLAASAATALLGSPPRVWRHGEAPAGQETRDYVTWTLAGGSPVNNLSELPPADGLSVQVDCWSATDAGVVALATVVRDAIEPVAHMTSVLADGRDADTRRFRIALQFEWWLAR